MIKKANNYLCIKTNKLRFLDIRHFLAPGFSYAKFLKAYHCEGKTFYFPFEYITSLEILDEEALPPHSVFYSSLKNSNISEKEYEFVKKVWMEKNWKSIRDMLVYHNICNCQPFIEANALVTISTKSVSLFLENVCEVWGIRFSDPLFNAF